MSNFLLVMGSLSTISFVKKNNVLNCLFQKVFEKFFYRLDVFMVVFIEITAPSLPKNEAFSSACFSFGAIWIFVIYCGGEVERRFDFQNASYHFSRHTNFSVPSGLMVKQDIIGIFRQTIIIRRN